LGKNDESWGQSGGQEWTYEIVDHNRAIWRGLTTGRD